VIEVHDGEEIATAPHLVQFRDALVNAAKSAPRRVINATGRGILRADCIEPLQLAAALRGASSYTLPALPRPLQPPDSLVRLRQMLRTADGDATPEFDATLAAWKGILAEHEGETPVSDLQLDIALTDLAAWSRESAATNL
jgi:hypothetical protein